MLCVEPYQVLEVEFGRWLNVPNVVACSSGTAALHLALESLRIPLGAEVILCDFNMVACARAVSLAGLTPCFVDCNLDDLLIDPKQVEIAVTPKTRVILATHIYGRRCDMEAVSALAREKDLYVIEDLAEAHGIPPHKDTDAACWSFYKNKVIAGEEGGAVAFRSKEAASLAKQLRCLGFTSAHDFNHVPRGCNYRLANALAIPILTSLYKVKENLEKRRTIEGWYEDECPQEWKMPKREVPWVYDLRLPTLNPAVQDAIVAALNKEGIAARHSFKPMSWQKEYETRSVLSQRKLSWNAARASLGVIYLPIVPDNTTTEEVARSFEVIHRVLSS